MEERNEERKINLIKKEREKNNWKKQMKEGEKNISIDERSRENKEVTVN